MQVQANRAERNIPALHRKVAIAVHQAVTIATPVDEGRARSNWLVGIGRARGETIPPYNPGRRGSTAGPNTQQSINAARSAVGTHAPGRDIHVTNNLDYIQFLNQGSSAQAPANYVQTAALQAAAAVGGARILTGRVQDGGGSTGGPPRDPNTGRFLPRG